MTIMLNSILDEIISQADTNRCVLFFETMPESKRKELAPRAMQWASATNGYIHRDRQQYVIFDPTNVADVEFYKNIFSKKVEFPCDFTEASFTAARVAMLATCGFVDLKKSGNKGLPEPELASKILLARNPNWLEKWCQYILKEATSTHWLALYNLERDGAITLQRSSQYWMSMLCTLANSGTIYDILSQDPKLLEEVWAMLADQGVIRMLAEPEQISHEIFRKRWNAGDNIFAPIQTTTRLGSECWRDALLKLASEKLLNLNQLIEYSFTILANAAEKESKKSPYQTTSTADFAIKLNEVLTRDSIVLYANRFSSLLGAVHKDVSTYASNALLSMPAETLNVSEISANIVNAFLNKNKEPAETALKLLTCLAKENPEQRSIYGSAILAGFNHTSKDIHKKTLALIDSTNLLEETELRSEFSQRVDMLMGMEKTNAIKLLEKYRSEVCTNSNMQESSLIESSFSLTELKNRVNKLDNNLKSLVRIDELIDSIENNKFNFDLPVVLDSLDFPRLNQEPDKAVVPISSLDDLIYLFTKVLSGKCDVMDIEKLLDGVSRLCNERPDNFSQKTETIRLKAQKMVQEYSNFGVASPLEPLALAWLGETSENAQVITSEPGSFFARRCLAISKRILSKNPAPLLSMPTHQAGWIDPRILVRRIQTYFWMKLEPDRVDFIQALLRIAPEHRQNALEEAGNIKGEMGSSLRYALGDNTMGPGLSQIQIHTPEYWIAAYRAREPWGSNSELQKLMPKFGPDGAVSASYGLNMDAVVTFQNDRYSSISRELPNFLPVTSCDPNFPGQTGSRSQYAFFPTVLLHDNSNSWFSGNETFNWLHTRESLLALYSKRMLQNINSVGSYWHGDFELLFDPDISMAGNGRYFLCVAMSSKNNDLSRLAVDGLIAAVSECRIDATGYGNALAEFLPTGVITSVRWARGLRDLSRVSQQHAHFAWQAIGTLLEKASLTSTQQIPYLEVLCELQVESRFSVDEKLKQALLKIIGSGKASKLANAILAFSGDSQTALTSAMQSLDSRINRVERWQRWQRWQSPII